MLLNKKLEIPSAWEMFQILKDRKNWSKRSPYRRWCFFYGIGRIAMSMMKMPFFQDDLTLSYFAYFPLAYISFYFIMGIYTIIYYVGTGDPIKAFPCTCLLFGPTLATSTIFAIILQEKRRYQAQSFCDFGGKYLYPDAVEEGKIDAKYFKMTSEIVDSTIRSYVIKMAMIMISATAGTLGPAYALFFEGRKASATDVKFPFVEAGSNGEYFGNILLQIIFTYNGILGYIGIEVAVNMVQDIFTAKPKIVEYNLSELTMKIEKKCITKVEMVTTFRNIVIQVIDVDRFVLFLVDLFFWRTLLTPPAFCYSIGMSIFCQYTMDFVAGYGMAMMSWVQLGYFCALTDTIEDCGFDNLLYCSDWYVLPVKLQVAMMYLIKEKQNGPKIRMGPLSIIDLKFFYVVSNKVYSFVMFLDRFFS